MKRRSRSGVAVALLAASIGVPCAAPPATASEVLKLATLVPSGSIWDQAVREMAADWREISSGDVEVRIYSGGIAGDDPDMIRKMRIGQLHAATVTVSGLTEIDPAFALFEIPLFFASYEELFHVLEALEEELDQRLEKQGYIRLHWAHAGWIHFFTTEAAATVEAFRRLKIFVWAGNDQMTGLWRQHGFRPVPLAATDILAGLESGLFQALPSTPIAALSLQWFRSAPFMVDVPLAPLIGATLVDLRAWRRLPRSYRDELARAAAAPGRRFTVEIPSTERLAIETMRKRGLEITPVLDTAQEAAWRTATEAFAEAMREAFVPSDVYDRALAARDAFRQQNAAIP